MNRTLMVGAMLTAAALAGCGGATQTASETASAPGAAAASSPGAASQSAQSGRSSHSAQSDQSTQAGRAERSAQPGGSTKPARSAQSAKPAPPADAGMAFTAYGRNTPWRAVVRKGTLTTEGPSVGEHTLRVTRSAWSKGVRFTGSEGGQKFSLVVRPGTCVDGSGQVATLSVGNRQLSGCAVSGAYPRVNT